MNSHQFDYSESNYVHIEKLQIAFKLCLQKLKSSRADAFNNTYIYSLPAGKSICQGEIFDWIFNKI